MIRSRYTPLAALPALTAATAGAWLSPAERVAWQTMRSDERRRTWLAGRIAAKRLIFASDNSTNSGPPDELDIRSSDAAGGQRPAVHAAGQLLRWALSIAHTARGVLVALSDEPGVTLGVDLVVCGHTQPLHWCFTPGERQFLAASRPHNRRAEQLWALKEALYKAAQTGEGFAPARIEVVPGRAPCYAPLSADRRVRSLQSWRVDGHLAALAVVEPAAALCPAASQSPVASNHFRGPIAAAC